MKIILRNASSNDEKFMIRNAVNRMVTAKKENAVQSFQEEMRKMKDKAKKLLDEKEVAQAPIDDLKREIIRLKDALNSVKEENPGAEESEGIE